MNKKTGTDRKQTRPTSEARRIEILTHFQNNNQSIKKVARELHTTPEIVSMVLEEAHLLGDCKALGGGYYRCGKCGGRNRQSVCLSCRAGTFAHNPAIAFAESKDETHEDDKGAYIPSPEKILVEKKRIMAANNERQKDYTAYRYDAQPGQIREYGVTHAAGASLFKQVS